MPTTAPSTPPVPLLDANCNHGRQHGVGLMNVVEHNSAATRRGDAYLCAMSIRHGRCGGLPLVGLRLNASAFAAFFDLTPEDADTLAASLVSAAAMAREVRALLEAGAGVDAPHCARAVNQVAA